MIDKMAAWFRRISDWLWRLAVSVIPGGLALVTLIPWAQTQRGYSAIGGEHMVVLVLFMLPYFFFLSPLRLHWKREITSRKKQIPKKIVRFIDKKKVKRNSTRPGVKRKHTQGTELLHRIVAYDNGNGT